MSRPVVALLALALVLASPLAARGSDPLLARAFVVHHRPLSDAADLVQPLLSPDGSVTLQPRLRTLVVQDRPVVLDRVAALLGSFDTPPRMVEVTLTLFLATEQRPGSARAEAGKESFSREVRGVIETLGDFTRWSAYEPLGSRSVIGVEGGQGVVVDLSTQYRVEFRVDAIEPARRLVSFGRLSLQRRALDERGAETVHNLYTAGLVVSTGKMQVVGAASDPGSKRALFLVLQVQEK